MGKLAFTKDDVKRIGLLANIPITSQEAEKLAQGFNSVISIVDILSSVNTNGIEPTHQVTGLTNIFREDIIDEGRTFTQKEAFQNAKNTYNGFFMVEQILEGD